MPERDSSFLPPPGRMPDKKSEADPKGLVSFLYRVS